MSKDFIQVGIIEGDAIISFTPINGNKIPGILTLQ